MFKMTKVELEKISNADIHLFIERSMRGGISSASKRIVKQIINIVQIIIKLILKNGLLMLI